MTVWDFLKACEPIVNTHSLCRPLYDKLKSYYFKALDGWWYISYATDCYDVPDFKYGPMNEGDASQLQQAIDNLDSVANKVLGMRECNFTDGYLWCGQTFILKGDAWKDKAIIPWLRSERFTVDLLQQDSSVWNLVKGFIPTQEVTETKVKYAL